MFKKIWKWLTYCSPEDKKREQEFWIKYLTEISKSDSECWNEDIDKRPGYL